MPKRGSAYNAPDLPAESAFLSKDNGAVAESKLLQRLHFYIHTIIEQNFGFALLLFSYLLHFFLLVTTPVPITALPLTNSRAIHKAGLLVSPV